MFFSEIHKIFHKPMMRTTYKNIWIFLAFFPSLFILPHYGIAEHSYKVEKINGVPYITIDGKPTRARMLYSVPGCTTGEFTKAGEWKDCSFEFESPMDCPKCAVHIRFRKDTQKLYIGKIEVKNLTEGKIEKSLDLSSPNLDPDMTFWCAGKGIKELPFSMKTANDSGTPVVLADIKPAKDKEMDGIHLLFLGLKTKAGNKYRVDIRIKTEYADCLDIGFRKQFDDMYLMGSAGKSCIDVQSKLAAAIGVDFINFPVYPPWAEDDTVDFGKIKAHMESIIRANPNAKMIPRLILYPSEEWRKKHPDDRIKGPDGRSDYFDDSYFSLSSEAYRKSAIKTMEMFIEFAESNFKDNMAGYHITNGRNQEWFYGNTWSQKHAGYDEATVKSWRKWLRKKYGDDKSLKSAWNNPAASIDAAEIPPPHRRDAAGSLVNPKSEADIADFNIFLQDEMANTMKLFADAARKAAPNRLILFFYGYGMEFSHAYNGPAVSGHYGLSKVLQIDSIDILCGPVSYSDRMFGGGKTTMGATETITRSGKIWLDEDDTSTYLAPKTPYPGSEKGLDTQEKTIKVLRRNLSQEVVRNLACWWMDLGGNGWFADPKLWEQMSALSPVEAELAENPSPYEPDTALIFDEISMCMIGGKGQSPLTSSQSLNGTRVALNRSAVPFGHYLAKDLISKRVKSKLKIFAALYALSGKDRGKIKSRASASYNIWTWLPGYIDLDKREFSLESVKELTGFDAVQAKKGTKAFVDSTPEGLEAGLPARFGFDVEIMLLAPVPQEGDKILAKFGDGTPAIIERGKNMFCAIPAMPPELMRYAARRAGVHIYTDAPAAVYANGKYVSICATADGPYEIDLGGTYKIREIFDSQDLGVSQKISFDMKKGDVKFLRLDPQ